MLSVRGVCNKLVVRPLQVQAERVREVIEEALEWSAAHESKRILYQWHRSHHLHI